MCPVGRLNTTLAAPNPDTSTARAAYCKSPCPHRPGLPSSPDAKSRSRSAVDTALEIWRESSTLPATSAFAVTDPIQGASMVAQTHSSGAHPKGSGHFEEHSSSRPSGQFGTLTFRICPRANRNHSFAGLVLRNCPHNRSRMAYHVTRSAVPANTLNCVGNHR